MSKKVLITAGGTGGHVFPALAAAKALQQQGILVEWLGTREGIEANIVVAAGIPMNYLSVKSIRGKGFLQLLKAPWQLTYALVQAMAILLKVKPSCVLGMGGFVAGPGGLAAWLLRKPLIIHEQNAVPGMTNKLLARFAKTILTAFPDAFPQTKKMMYVGNPVREEIINLLPPKIRYSQRKGRLQVLIVGGSLGASAINQLVPLAITTLAPKEWPDIWHQTGQHDQEQVKQAYSDIGIYAKVEPFIDNMARAYAWADIVICRAGALTLSELMAAGVASILIPYPQAVDDHQTKNATYLEQVGAAILMSQAEISQIKLCELIRDFTYQRDKLITMADAARSLARPGATKEVVSQCLKVINNG